MDQTNVYGGMPIKEDPPTQILLADMSGTGQVSHVGGGVDGNRETSSHQPSRADGGGGSHLPAQVGPSRLSGS